METLLTTVWITLRCHIPVNWQFFADVRPAWT